MRMKFVSFQRLFCLTLASAASVSSLRALPFPIDPGSLPGDLGFAILLSSSPFNGQTQVPLNSPVSFTFLTAMKPQQSITWSSNVDPGKFNCTWGADAKTLTCKYATDLPASATIAWTLDPATFQDQAGNALMPVNNSGSFTTAASGSSTNNPCDGGSTNSGVGSVSITKSISYVQTSTSAPVIDADQGAMFGAFLNSPTTNPVTQATLQLPNGTTKPFTNLFGNFMLVDQFQTQEALDAAYPGGIYTVTMTRASGSAVLRLNLNTTAPPTPTIANFAQVAAFDPTADLLVQWQPFTGATVNDGIFFQMNDGLGAEFHAPDPCVPRTLANTAISITVPKNTFGSGGDMNGLLSFSKGVSFDTNSVRDIFGYSAFSKTTSFKPSNSGPPPAPAHIESIARQQDGSIKLHVTATAGASVVIQATSDLRSPISWVPLPGVIAVSGAVDVFDPQAATLPKRFYRPSP